MSNNILAFLEETKTQNFNSIYSYEGKGVPRVTEILSAMLHEQSLMEWSNAMGLYKHLKYRDILDQASDIGTYTHKAIEEYLSENKDLDEKELPNNVLHGVHFAFGSFLEWWDIIKSNDYEIIYQEYTLVCKWFGGTLDLYIRINGKKYIVDFKTSNHSSYKHFLQISAYRYMLREQGEDVDGVIILMLDKKSYTFTEYVLDFENLEQLSFMDTCEQCFLSLLLAFYNRHKVQHMFEKIKGGDTNNERKYNKAALFARR